MARLLKGKVLITSENEKSKLSDTTLVAVVGLTQEEATPMVQKIRDGVEIPKEQRGQFVNIQIDSLAHGVSVPQSIKESAKGLTGEAFFNKVKEGLEAKGIDMTNAKLIRGTEFKEGKETKFSDIVVVGLSEEVAKSLVVKTNNGTEIDVKDRGFYKTVTSSRITNKEDGSVVLVPKDILDKARADAGVEKGHNTPAVYENIKAALTERYGISFSKKDPSVDGVEVVGTPVPSEVSEPEVPEIER